MKKYNNKLTLKQYIEGDVITYCINEFTIFSGIPNKELLLEWGFEELISDPILEPTEEESERQNLQDRLILIEEELKSMDYLTSKYIDGEDMTKYGDWLSTRRQLRQEYREIEELLNNL